MRDIKEGPLQAERSIRQLEEAMGRVYMEVRGLTEPCICVPQEDWITSTPPADGSSGWE